MLNAALRTSQQRVLGTAILQWDMFSLDVCHVLQFYREVLAEPISHNNSLIILDHPWSSLIILDHLVYFGIIWNLDIFLETFGYFWILLGYIGDLLEIHHQGFISYHQLYSANMYNFDISISYKSSFFWFTNYKSDIFHFASFSHCVSPLCFPVVFPLSFSPLCLPSMSHRFWVEVLRRPFRLSAKKEQTDGNKMKQNETERFSRSFRHFSPVYKIEGVGSEHLEPLGSIKLKCIRQDGQEQLEYSGQLSIKKGWGAWFYIL